MRFRLLACDYDRTIATDGAVGETVRNALASVRDSGRRLLLITGRTEAELLQVFQDLELFDRIVIENGGVLRDPATGGDRLMCDPLPGLLLSELRRRGVRPLVVGQSMVSTAASNEAAVRAALAGIRMERNLVLNRDSVMVMPPGCSKATGLETAAAELGVSLAETVAVGDGENDLAFLDVAGVSVAVENAVEPLKQRADIVLRRPGADGIADLCESLAQRDLEDLLEVSPAAT
jgi:hydroxymethylpyrimidine pyrophosphatase-like HAD family hydrolase